MEQEEIFLQKAEEDLGEYVDMIIGIEEHIECQYSSPVAYMQFMCDYTKQQQSIYDDILEAYECDCGDISIEEKIKIGFDQTDLGSALVHLTDQVLDAHCYDGYEIYDNNHQKRFLTDEEKNIMNRARRLIIDGELKEAYELVLTIDSGKYGVE